MSVGVTVHDVDPLSSAGANPLADLESVRKIANEKLRIRRLVQVRGAAAVSKGEGTPFPFGAGKVAQTLTSFLMFGHYLAGDVIAACAGLV